MPINVTPDPLKAHEKACDALIYAVESLTPAAVRLTSEGDTSGYDSARLAVTEAYRALDYATTHLLKASEGVEG